jgi:hypothetical protein
MPTVNPRVNVTLSPSLDTLVRRLATWQRVSRSQVLRELLEAAEPALQRAAALMEAADQAHGALHRDLAKRLDRAQGKAEAQLGSILASMDAATGDLVAQAQAVRGRRPGPGAKRPSQGASTGQGAQRGASNPPASNRGVKSAGPGSRRRSGGRS